MPSIADMIELADAMRISPIEVDDIKCVAVRNRNSSCRRCMDACIEDAIEVNSNEISIDAALCVNCGACVDVCPTSALSACNPTENGVLAEALRTSRNADGHITIACARKAAKHEGDTEKYANVPCLGHMTGHLLTLLATEDVVGASDGKCAPRSITLVDGDCVTCKFGAVSPSIDATCDDAQRILCAAGCDLEIVRTPAFPGYVIDADGAANRGKSRRGLARQTGSYIKTIAGNVAVKTIEDKLGMGGKDEPTSLRDRLKAGKNGKIPTFQPTSNYQIIECMERLLDNAMDASDNRLSDDAFVDSRRFGSVRVDPEKCSGCGMCVLFCPTEALRYAKFDEPADESLRYVEFQASDCTRCMLCKDVCLRHCLEVDEGAALGDLLDFEPQLIEIRRPQNQAFLTDIKNRFRKI